ncbi:MAG: hypothetical protein ACRDFQ_07910, partial [Anaerolineales bacterium]
MVRRAFGDRLSSAQKPESHIVVPEPQTATVSPEFTRRMFGAEGHTSHERATPMPDLSAIHPGLTGIAHLTVAPEHTAPRVGSGRIAVLATPVMINVIEAAAL